MDYLGSDGELDLCLLQSNSMTIFTDIYPGGVLFWFQYPNQNEISVKKFHGAFSIAKISYSRDQAITVNILSAPKCFCYIYAFGDQVSEYRMSLWTQRIYCKLHHNQFMSAI